MNVSKLKSEEKKSFKIGDIINGNGKGGFYLISLNKSKFIF